MARPSARRTFGAIALAASVVAACNAISGLDGDYELAGGGVPPAEAGIDSSSGDSGPTDQLDADAPEVDVDAPTGSDALDCASPPAGPTPTAALLWCDNFDDTSRTANLWGWTRRQATSGVPMVEPDVGFVARGLRADVTTTGSPPSEGWVTALWKTIPGGLPDTQRLTMRMRFKVATAEIHYTVLGAVQLNGLEYGIALYSNPSCPGSTGTCIDENDHAGGHGGFAGAVPLTLDQWYEAEIVVTRSGNAFGGKVTLSGTATPLDDRATGVLPTGTASSVEVGVGAFFSSDRSRADVVVDDVLVWRH